MLRLLLLVMVMVMQALGHRRGCRRSHGSSPTFQRVGGESSSFVDTSGTAAAADYCASYTAANAVAAAAAAAVDCTKARILLVSRSAACLHARCRCTGSMR
jgi:hypothetical protein